MEFSICPFLFAAHYFNRHTLEICRKPDAALNESSIELFIGRRKKNSAKFRALNRLSCIDISLKGKINSTLCDC
jgi:hypothetical protein